VDHHGVVTATLDRSRLWLAQTPQAFRYEIIVNAHLAAKKERYVGTDDAALVERMGINVNVIPGSRRNIKLTDPEDLELAEAILQQSRS
jgi:2-C-methyl-D-erythritol 4-phosphate cytidylyltransferase